MICLAASEVDILSESEVINHVADFVPQNAIDFDKNSTQESVRPTSCNLPSSDRRSSGPKGMSQFASKHSTS